MPERKNDAWTDAWSERYEACGSESPTPRRGRRISLPLRGRTKGVHVILSAVLLSMLITPFAIAQSSGSGSARVVRDDDRYAFLARNIRAGDGGAGAFACRSDANPAGQTNREPCLNMVNTGTGYAAAFRTRGNTGFRLQTSGTGEATPFLLDANATGLVRNLNSDKVDGLDAGQIGRELTARVSVAGDGTPTLVRGNGTAAQNAVTRVGAGDYRVEFASEVNACVYQATSADTSAARLVAASEDASNTKRVVVSTRDAVGAGAGIAIDAPFHLTVSC
jgi:hypothetical protein